MTLICACAVITAAHAQRVLLRADNVDSVLAQMTLREKATLVVGNGWGSLFEGFRIPFCHGHRLPGAAGESRAIERLGIPSIILADGPAGVRLMKHQMTAFPTGISLASTRDTALIRAVGVAMGEEARAVGVDVLLMPGMNLMRNPLCGRNYEYYSEDPDLSGQIAAAMVKGVQSVGVGTSVKHYAMNNQETNRFRTNAIVDSATMHDLYLRNFRIAIDDSKPWTVMASYITVNGTPVMRNKGLLTDILREQWGYEGAVITDWEAHRRSYEKIAAGVDLLTPGMTSRIGEIYRAVKKGKLSEERLNEAAKRVLELIVKTHTFKQDGGQPYDTLQHEALARRAGAAGCVLLKNEGAALPLRQEKQTVALFGVHSYHLLCGGTGSGYVNCRHRIALDTALIAADYRLHDELAGAYKRYMGKPGTKRRIKGMSIVSKYMGQHSFYEMSADNDMIQRAVHASDVALVTIGRQAGEGADRHLEKGDFYLSDTERELLEQVSAAAHAEGKRMVVVLNIAGVIETASWRDLADAILLVWCPGQEGGFAVADVLTGAVAPTGKLPVTFPVRYEDLPSAANFPLRKLGVKDVKYTVYEEKMNIGHLYFDAHPEVEVAYPYGFGLSYLACSSGK